MKWHSITKDGSSIFVVNKMKNFNIKSKEECIKFIHKKNPNKGKIQSIVLEKLNNCSEKNAVDWVVYYTSPLNKNHINSEWKLNTNNKIKNVYNGIVVIRTKSNSDDYPYLLDTIDINNKKDLDNFKNLETTKETFEENINDQVDDEDIDDDDDDEELIQSIPETDEQENVFTDSDDDDDELTEEKTIEQNKTKTIELKDDLIAKETLQYESYDYDSKIIPEFCT
tara:strand:+ start:2289 stop:2963 length:675 start_codon:yes stop_codon:yes gene_type:complete